MGGVYISPSLLSPHRGALRYLQGGTSTIAPAAGSTAAPADGTPEPGSKPPTVWQASTIGTPEEGYKGHDDWVHVDEKWNDILNEAKSCEDVEQIDVVTYTANGYPLKYQVNFLNRTLTRTNPPRGETATEQEIRQVEQVVLYDGTQSTQSDIPSERTAWCGSSRTTTGGRCAL